MIRERERVRQGGDPVTPPALNPDPPLNPDNPVAPPGPVSWTQHLPGILNLFQRITGRAAAPEIMAELGKAFRGEPMGILTPDAYLQLNAVLDAGRAEGLLNPAQINALEAILSTPSALVALNIIPPPLPPHGDNPGGDINPPQLPDPQDPARAREYLDLINQFNALYDANRFDEAFALVDKALDSQTRLNYSQRPEISVRWEDLLTAEGQAEFFRQYSALDPSHSPVFLDLFGPDGRPLNAYADALIIPSIRILVDGQPLTLQQAIDHITPWAPEFAAVLEQIQNFHRLTVLEELTHAVDFADPNARLSPSYRSILFADPTFEYDSEINFLFLAIENGWVESWAEIEDLIYNHPEERRPAFLAMRALLENLFRPATPPTPPPLPPVDPATPGPETAGAGPDLVFTSLEGDEPAIDPESVALPLYYVDASVLNNPASQEYLDFMMGIAALRPESPAPVSITSSIPVYVEPLSGENPLGTGAYPLETSAIPLANPENDYTVTTLIDPAVSPTAEELTSGSMPYDIIPFDSGTPYSEIPFYDPLTADSTSTLI